MAAKDDLAFIANRIRGLTASATRTSSLAYSVSLLIREAIRLGAFADVKFVEFRDYFDRDVRDGARDTLNATRWLSDNGASIGLESPTAWLDNPLGFPALVRVRPHFEFLAMLLEGKRATRRQKRPKGKAGRPGVTGTKEQRDLQLFAQWKTAKDAGVSAKDFCKDPDNGGITINDLERIVAWVGTRRRRGQV